MGKDMKMETISAYLRFEQLDEYKNITRKGITTPRKQPRFDLVAGAGYWQSLMNLRNYKGQIFLNMIPTEQNQHRQQSGRASEYYLQVCPAKSRSVNFSGVRFLYDENKKPIYGSGEPSNEKVLKGGVTNPMYENREDGFLFIFSDDWQQLEVIVIDNGQLLIDAYRKKLALGLFNSQLEVLRKQAKPFKALL